jgi:WD40 repeat protein
MRTLCALFLTDGRRYVTVEGADAEQAEVGCRIHFRDAEHSRPTRTVNFKQRAYAAAVSGDGGRLLLWSAETGPAPKHLGVLYDLRTGKELSRGTSASVKPIADVLLSPDGKSASATERLPVSGPSSVVAAHLTRWSEDLAAAPRRWPCSKQGCWALDWRTAAWLEDAGNPLRACWGIDRTSEHIHQLSWSRGAYNPRAVTISGNQKLFVVSLQDSQLEGWILIRTPGGNQDQASIPTGREYAGVLALSPDSVRLAAALPGRILLFDTSTGKEIAAARSPDDPPLLHEALTFALDGRRVLSVASDGAAYLWDLPAP